MDSTIQWPDKTLPTGIFCAPGVLTGLEIAAADGLLAMPRIGLGVGGLLLGRRNAGRIEIQKSAAIACSHAFGPAFVLTPAEIAKSCEDAGAEVVGWYCSKTQGPAVLSEHDRALFTALCPESWQVMLLIQPRMSRTTTAAFGYRGGGSEDGFVLGDWLELAWQELAAFQAPAEAAGIAVAEPEVAPELFLPVPMARSGTLFGIPSDPPEEKRARRRPLRLAVGTILLAAAAGAAYILRDDWMPRLPIALMASADSEDRVSFLWNGEALSEQDWGTLVIDDGNGPLHTIHLDQARVRSGWYQYDCRPGNVTATLLAGKLSDMVTVKAPPEAQLPDSGISK
jgi:proteasome lid subunit RPN8/RPN11